MYTKTKEYESLFVSSYGGGVWTNLQGPRLFHRIPSTPHQHKYRVTYPSRLTHMECESFALTSLSTSYTLECRNTRAFRGLNYGFVQIIVYLQFFINFWTSMRFMLVGVLKTPYPCLGSPFFFYTF